MKSVNPVIKLVSLLIITFILAYKYSFILNIAFFAVSVALMLISKVRLKTLMMLMLPIAFTAVGMFFTGYRFSSGANMPINADILQIGDSALINGLTQASRVLAYAGTGLLFALTTDRVMMIGSFKKQLHIPQAYIYGLFAAWGVFPHMVDEYKRTRAAYKARGLYAFPLSPTLIKSLLVKSAQWSVELAIAMESKGFSGSSERSEYEPVRVNAKDWAFMICSIGITALASFYI